MSRPLRIVTERTGSCLRQLFENQSVVEYWENFANHAFENTTQSVYSHCVLLKPSGAPVPCTFCFSIRRDIMDLPSLVIGASRRHLRLSSASADWPCRSMATTSMIPAYVKRRHPTLLRFTCNTNTIRRRAARGRPHAPLLLIIHLAYPYIALLAVSDQLFLYSPLVYP